MIKVNDIEVMISKNSMSIDDAIEERSTSSFVVIDMDGSETYSKGQTVEITDDDSNVVFAGAIGKPVEKKDVVSGIKYHTLNCVDWHYLADKRIIAKAYEETLAGDIIRDICKNYLEIEGIVYQETAFKQHWDTQPYSVVNTTVNSTINGILNVTSSTADPMINMQAIGSFDPNVFRFIEIKYRVVSGVAGNTEIFFTNDQYTGASGAQVLATSMISDGQWHTLFIDGWAHQYWKHSNIRGWRYDWCTASGVTMELDYIRLVKLDEDDAIQDGPLVTEAVFNYVNIASAIDAVTEKANFIWFIDFEKKLYFVERSTYTAPFAITTKDAIKNSVSVETDNTKYRNKQYIKGGRDITDPLTESFSGDGKTRTWGVGFPIAKVPTVNLNGVTLTTSEVGIRGLDSDKKYYWSKGYNEITQDDSQTLLISTSTLEITYQGEYDIVAITFDPEQIDERKTIEGNSGIVENVADEIENTSRDTAFQSANAKLKKFGTIGRRLKFTTMKTGLKTGQLLTVNMPEHGVDGLQMLIESITVTRQDNLFYYKISAVEGPSQQSWAKMFEVMATRGQAFVVRQNISEKQILITLATFSKTWESATDPNIFEEVYASDTLFPSATLYPMFAITDRVKYIELLDSSDVVLLRKSVTKQVGADTASILSTIYVAPFEANAQIAKVRFYGGMRATLANGSGVLIDEQVYSKLKTQLEAIQLEKTDTRNFVPATGTKALSTAYWQAVDDTITALTAHSA